MTNVVTDLLNVRVTITRWNRDRSHSIKGVVRAVAFATAYSLIVQKDAGDLVVVAMEDGVGVAVEPVVPPAMAGIVDALTPSERELLHRMMYERPLSKLTCLYGSVAHSLLVDFACKGLASVVDSATAPAGSVSFGLTAAGCDVARALRPVSGP